MSSANSGRLEWKYIQTIVPSRLIVYLILKYYIIILLIFLQLTSTKPYLRKKAVLMMYKVFLRFPEALRPAFPRLKEKLEDPDSGW